jgi:hypothetical protein
MLIYPQSPMQCSATFGKPQSEIGGRHRPLRKLCSSGARCCAYLRCREVFSISITSPLHLASPRYVKESDWEVKPGNIPAVCVVDVITLD